MSICKTCHNKPFFYTEAPDVQAYCPDCGKAHDLKRGGDAVYKSMCLNQDGEIVTLRAELAAVKAELVQIYEERDGAIKKCLEVTAELKKAKEDSELLDWLDKCNVGAFAEVYNKTVCPVRQAIRSAIAASKEAGK